MTRNKIQKNDCNSVGDKNKRAGVLHNPAQEINNTKKIFMKNCPKAIQTHIKFRGEKKKKTPTKQRERGRDK